MKTAIPVETNKPGACINKTLGRTPFFLVYDTDTKEAQYIENTAARSQGGAGIRAAQLIVDSGADVVIAPACGKNTADVLAASDIRILRSSGCSVKDNLNALMEGSLEELKDIHPGFHRHGG